MNATEYAVELAKLHLRIETMELAFRESRAHLAAVHARKVQGLARRVKATKREVFELERRLRQSTTAMRAARSTAELYATRLQSARNEHYGARAPRDVMPWETEAQRDAKVSRD